MESPEPILSDFSEGTSITSVRTDTQFRQCVMSLLPRDRQHAKDMDEAEDDVDKNAFLFVAIAALL